LNIDPRRFVSDPLYRTYWDRQWAQKLSDMCLLWFLLAGFGAVALSGLPGVHDHHGNHVLPPVFCYILAGVLGVMGIACLVGAVRFARQAQY
jgi:hypothetical protein